MGPWLLLGIILTTPGQPTIIHVFKEPPHFQAEAECKRTAVEFVEVGTQWEYEDNSTLVPLCELASGARRA